MFYLKKEVHISSSHHLRDYDGPCAQVHGHNWHITVYCSCEALNKLGMIVDFREIKKAIMKYDHANINEIPPFDTINPTAENMAEIICRDIPNCYRVDVEETKGATASYVKN
jgi:6-pyruvoyltetrahydropterin/6-carboxytetrahydropterin synthase